MSRSVNSSIFFLSLNEKEKRGAKFVLEREVWLKLKGHPSRRHPPGILPAQNFPQPYSPTVPHEVGQSFAVASWPQLSSTGEGPALSLEGVMCGGPTLGHPRAVGTWKAPLPTFTQVAFGLATGLASLLFPLWNSRTSVCHFTLGQGVGLLFLQGTQGQSCSLLTRKATERAMGTKRGVFLILLLFLNFKCLSFFWKYLRGLTESRMQEVASSAGAAYLLWAWRAGITSKLSFVGQPWASVALVASYSTVTVMSPPYLTHRQ